ncbi:hypothetical protein MFLAVUS_008017 [Mucor flavus]|uniref:Uncharacterized protein n=1 Tax=Mucor flavus TaxID=439312 RepID=A0ABP9Z5X1_9FUNG
MLLKSLRQWIKRWWNETEGNSTQNGYTPENSKSAFSDFVSRKYNATQLASYSLQSETTLALHSHWVKQYNEVVEVERVGQNSQTASNELRDEFDSSLDETDKKMIDNLFAEFKVFADKLRIRIVTYIVYRIVFDIPGWSREQKFCEATFVRKFLEILDILFKNTKIFAKDGESSSQAAKSNQSTNKDGTQYGRKLGVLILSEQNDYDGI